MQKHIIGHTSPLPPPREPQGFSWLNLENLADVEITSEDSHFPIEGALSVSPGSNSPGWRAAEPGEQTVRFYFNKPLNLRHLRLVIEEVERSRTQEILIRTSQGGAYREVVRQQFNFSPPNTTREVENFEVHLDGVRRLEIWINPDVSGNKVPASIKQICLG